MPFLRYEALDQFGKTINGSAEANSPGELAKLLQQRGFQPVSIDGQKFAASIPKRPSPPLISTTATSQKPFPSSRQQTAASSPPAKVSDPSTIAVMSQFFTFSQWADLTRAGMEQGQIIHHFRTQGTSKASAKYFSGRTNSYSVINMISAYMNPAMWILFVFNYFFDRRGSVDQMYSELERAFYQGRSISSEMELRPRHFAPYIASTIKVGEVSGSLPEAMDQIAETSRRSFTFTLMQMTFVTGFPFFIWISSYGYAISQASQAAINRHLAGGIQMLPTEDPASFGKRILMEELAKQSDFVSKGFWIALGFSVISGVFMLPQLRKTRHMIAMALPFAYGRAKAEAIERITWALSKGMDAGLSAASIMHTAVGTIPNLWLRDRVMSRIGNIKENEGILDILMRSTLFPHQYLSMLHTAQVAGTQSRSLSQISTIETSTYERKTNIAYWTNRILIMIMLGSIIITAVFIMWNGYGKSMSNMIQSTMNE